MKNKSLETVEILELFGGIGACTKALKNIGINVNVADYVEIDKYAVKSYNAINNTKFEPQDICSWDKNINVDLIMHGSPCQDFSLAGKQAGGDKNSGTRSSLMYETIRIIEKLNPKYVIWENVKNLLSKKHKHNFDNYIDKLNELGYNSYYKILNAKDYGIPQNRERIYVVSIRKDVDNGNFRFPKEEKLKLRLKDILEKEVDEKYYLNNTYIEKINKSIFLKRKMHFSEDLENLKCVRIGGIFDTEKSKHQAGSIYDKEQLAPTLDTMQGGWRQPLIETSYNKTRIRKLTPLECWRLMGFTDKDFEKAKTSGNSNTQLYKQAGNSIVVNILEKIFKNLFKGD